MKDVSLDPRSLDTYVRLLPDRREYLIGSPPSQEAGALAFLDVDARPGAGVDSIVDVLQYVPHALVSTEILVFRWPEVTPGNNPAEEALVDQRVREAAIELAERAENLSIRHPYTGIVRFTVGGAPRVYWADRVPPVSENSLLARSCAVELLSLLEMGNGIWSPADYHYRLPSGMHSETFVRVADALRRPRDAAAFATWLLPRVSDQVGILLDTGTLTPLVSSLETLMQLREWRLGPVAVLDDYPRTRVDTMRAARTASGGGGQALGLLSVSSSGRIRDLLYEALEAATARDEWSLIVLIDKLHEKSEEFSAKPIGSGVERISTWVSLRDRGVLSENEGECKRCRSNRGARLVHIDPRSFAPMVLPEPELLRPDVTDGRLNFLLWETAMRAGAIGVEARPYESSLRSLPKHHLLSVRLHLDDLFGEPGFGEAVERRVGDIRNGTTQQDEITISVLDKLPSCSAVVVTTDDSGFPGFEAVRSLLESIAGLPKDIPLFRFDPTKQSLEAGLEAHENILILALGTVTGWTLRLLRIAVEEASRGSVHRVHGLVIHARPTSAREWRTMRNQFRPSDLGALWITYFPWRSPLREESEILKWLDGQRDRLNEEERRFLDARLAYSSPDDALVEWSERVVAFQTQNQPELHAGGIFWGMFGDEETLRLRGRSFFGLELDGLATYAAVGSAVHRARSESRVRSAPEWRVFDLPSIFRSYFDALIIVSILRWIEPSEAWWGSTPSEATQLLMDLISRTKDNLPELRVLLGELLLAAAEGKVHPAAQEELLQMLPTLTNGWSGRDLAPVTMGEKLIRGMRLP